MREQTGGGDKRKVPTSLQVDGVKVLPTFEAAFGSEANTANQGSLENSEEAVEAEEVTESSHDTMRRSRKAEQKRKAKIGEGDVLQQTAGLAGQETYIAEDINDLIKQASRATSLVPTPAPGASSTLKYFLL